MDFVLDKGDQKVFTFSYTPESLGMKHVSMVVLSEEGSYEDGLVASLEVVKEKEWWEDIWNALRGILDSLFRALGIS
jgi:hypothetical protein